ncbi:hypothetical protein ACTWP4_04805 [Gracilibacillus sp. D59]|uniref:hypothetical protein n=1 Tax=Gracilibacillus sp. D59 TaxID=3457434 RepID=UPI003FCDE11E
MKRFLVVILSTLLFALLYAWITYVPISERSPNVYYFGSLETFSFVVVYSGAIYILGGLPVSILIDRLTEKVNNKPKWVYYLVRLIIYSLGGIVVSFVYLIITLHDLLLYELLRSAILGFIAANIYFHFLLLTSYLKEKLYLLSNHKTPKGAGIGR